ncbi:MAG: ABC transporter ATP-binding protein [Gammaproteobacteria bacterium]|nr:ABC transporter ATP-binding protein [Gammaproteobacteria bacterium]
MIEVSDLHKRFGSLVAVDGVSMKVARGEVLGFLGPNGAGKSTTMKMITGFLAPDSGSVRISGQELGANPIAAKSRIGYLPEGAPAYGEMTPATFLDFIGDIRGLAPASKQARIREVVAKIHLEGVLHQTIETLSKGFKRRVGLAQAILHDPEILIMDEPTDGLDPNQKHEVRQLIREMSPHKAIIISTHILEEVDAVCTRAVIIAKGKLLFSGTPPELAARSAFHNAVTLSVPAAMVDAVEKSLRAMPGVAGLEQGVGSDDHLRLTVLPKSGETLFPRIRQAADDAGWPVREMFVEGGRLDEVFRSITTSTAASAGGHRS